MGLVVACWIDVLLQMMAFLACPRCHLPLKVILGFLVVGEAVAFRE
jgi:hypothetical protein